MIAAAVEGTVAEEDVAARDAEGVCNDFEPVTLDVEERSRSMTEAETSPSSRSTSSS